MVGEAADERVCGCGDQGPVVADDELELAAPLTAREHEVLLLLAHGRSNKIVARELDISVRTVETHRFSLRRKLGVDSASELLKIAVTNGWTTL